MKPAAFSFVLEDEFVQRMNFHPLTFVPHFPLPFPPALSPNVKHNEATGWDVWLEMFIFLQALWIWCVGNMWEWEVRKGGIGWWKKGVCSARGSGSRYICFLCTRIKYAIPIFSVDQRRWTQTNFHATCPRKHAARRPEARVYADKLRGKLEMTADNIRGVSVNYLDRQRSRLFIVFYLVSHGGRLWAPPFGNSEKHCKFELKWDSIQHNSQTIYIII